jgi:hypothetical protein
MKCFGGRKGISRREFLKLAAAGVCMSVFQPSSRKVQAASTPANPLFWVKDVPDELRGNNHAGVDQLLDLMGGRGLKFYRSSEKSTVSGPSGMIRADDVVLIKVNAQWKYRGCTNSDLIRGLIQRILDHPDGFTGEVVIIENGQGRGSLNCDTSASYSDSSVHANAQDESHSFLYLVNTVFNDPRVAAYLLDPIRSVIIGSDDHVTDGYRIYENVSYPCFTTAGGNRVELREGLWQGSGYSRNIKLINVPVLKHHDTDGSEITESLKHFYGILSMSDGQSGFRHYQGLGETCGKMVVSVRTPVLNIIDAIWVSYSSITGYPQSTTFRADQILASQDPVALDYWAAKYILHPIDNNPRHHPDFNGIDKWLTDACNIINDSGGLYNKDDGILVNRVTKRENEMRVYARSITVSLLEPLGDDVIHSGSTYRIQWEGFSPAVKFRLWYSTNNGSSWRQMTDDFVAGSSYDWHVPTPRDNKTKCLVKVIGYDSSDETVGSDQSVAPFTIEVLRVTTPGGGDQLFSNEHRLITWENNGTMTPVGKVKLFFSTNAGASWHIIETLPGNPKTYEWTVPAVRSTQTRCKVRVVLKGVSGNTVGSGVSDGTFTINF